MEQVPSLTGRTKGQKKKKAKTEHISSTNTENGLEGLAVFCDVSWIKTDIHQTNEAFIIQTDMPGVSPETDVVVQTDGNKLVIKGERKRMAPVLEGDNSEARSVIIERPFGTFLVEVVLPMNADTGHTEQTYGHGVLTVKVPLTRNQWRTLNIMHLSP